MGEAAALSPRDCVKLPTAGERLACFDKVFPLAKASEPKVDSKANTKKEFRDITVEENARVEKHINSICRGC
jgi:hypothetical protein